jgi:hypothetical protein
MRGMIRRWWRFVRTEAAPNPTSARLFNAREQNQLQPILVRRGGQVVIPRVDLLLQHLAGVGGRPGSSLWR